MDYLQYNGFTFNKNEFMDAVLNLIINGLPSIQLT